MMLVHKQPPPLLAQPPLAHRRHPSAPPTVIVQPTRTPGLLSLSKPPKASPQRQLNPAQRPQQQRSPKPRQQQPQRPALLNAAEISDKKAAVRPNKKQAKPSDAAKSTPPRHGKHRQPSPPIHDPSQAEDTSDPFLDFSPSTTFKPNTPRPANKRRSHMPLTVQTPSKAIPVPAAPRPAGNKQLSRSEPAVSHSWEHICDDSNDESSFTPPTTPLRARPAFASFSGPVRETPKRKVRNHRRMPSDQMFAMSSDDEAVSSGSEDLRALLDYVRSGSRPSSTTATPPPQRMAHVDVRSLSPASREKYFELEAQKEVAGYFASSSFQNSPSPDDLPEPTFA